MKRRSVGILASVALALGICVVAVPAAQAYTLTGCSWGGPNITWEDQVPASYDAAAASASSRWSTATDVNLSSSTAHKALVVGVSNEGANGMDGYTWWNCPFGSSISAFTTLNPYYTDAFTTNKRTAIYVHEFGHALGLNHATASTVMMYTSPGYVYNTYGYISPRTDDINGMNSIY